MKIPTVHNCGYLDNKKIDLSLSSNRMERVMGIEPTQPAWKAGILTIELHPQTTFSILANKMQKVNIKL